MEKIYTSKEVAEILKVHPRIVSAKIRAKELEAVNISSDSKPRYRITESQLQSYLNRNTTT